MSNNEGRWWRDWAGWSDRRVTELIYRRPARGWLGHHAHVGVVFAYGVASAAFGATEVFRHGGEGGRLMAPALFLLYVALTAWLVLVWGYHLVLAECVPCDDAVLRFRSASSWVVAGRWFGWYHFVASWNTWFYFQVFVAVAAGIAEAGYWWVWLVGVPVVLFVGVAWAAAGFHSRYGLSCPVCRRGPRRSEMFFAPYRGVSR